MLAERLTAARKYLDDARFLLAAGRLESAVSRAYYASYQAMWAALGDPPSGGQWRHLGIISHFVRGHWFEPAHPQRGSGNLEHLRLPLHRLYQFRIDVDYDGLSLDIASVRECLQTAERAVAEIEQRAQGGSP